MASPRTSRPSDRPSALVFEMVSVLNDPLPASLDNLDDDRDTEVDPPSRPFELHRPPKLPARTTLPYGDRLSR